MAALVALGGLLNWNSTVIREASRIGNYGKIIELARTHRRMTQAQLGEACGLSQSAISRLEKRGVGPYAMDVLLRVSQHLNIPAVLLGLADPAAQARIETENVERRQFLGAAAAVALSPALAVVTGPTDDAEQQANALRLATTSYRRLDGSTPSRELSEAVRSHLRLVQGLVGAAPTDAHRIRLAAVASEVASLNGWLAWDMGDHGSARSFYGAAIKAARAGANPLLAAYQAGSLAQFEAHAGNGVQALSLAKRARNLLEPGFPVVADAWLSSIEALGHAASGDQRSADRALTRSRAAIQTNVDGEPPPWPWVFTLDEAKVAGFRVTCGAKLGLSRWILDSAGPVLTTGHAKQRALLMLDIAAGHLSAGRIEAAFAIATQALDIGLQYRSGRIVERGRALRRSFTTSSAPKVVREFDERMHDVHL
ncbi:helix-turn-helix domain-containing protein [Kitasatospora cathayae]|uniref:Helix-turn-helix transcriptional regulator n=1 Tax=Kitasatospora cathayae TaxID=3004092 RepID=A0ABY7QCC6_9ACTN|nr:helix-turn-helix transcriptional regulator [Kitasatospora sp. HUAS 3-15]WBP90124.1 helix-turn-helix transcriptional regulator [Kitasatospora sp. HUAS 3-15]